MNGACVSDGERTACGPRARAGLRERSRWHSKRGSAAFARHPRERTPRNFSDAASSLWLRAPRLGGDAAHRAVLRTSRRVASSRVASSARPRAFGGFGLANTRDGPGGDAEPSPDEAAPLPPHFDLDTSILLAGFAFESYLSPEGGLRDADVNGGSTAYLSDFVRDVFAGIVEVTAIRAEDSPRATSSPVGATPTASSPPAAARRIAPRRGE